MAGAWVPEAECGDGGAEWRMSDGVLSKSLSAWSTSRRSVALSLALATVVVLTIADLLAAPSVRLTLLYLLPVMLISWVCGERAGIALAALSSVAPTYQLLHAEPPAGSWFIAWNTLSRLVLWP